MIIYFVYLIYKEIKFMKTLEPRMDSAPSLETIDIPIRLATEEESTITKEDTYLNATYKGIPIRLRIRNSGSFRDGLVSLINIKVNVSTPKEIDVAYVHVKVVEGMNQRYIADTDVVNKDREIKELGRNLWEVSLKLIQQFADRLNIPITHVIARLPDQNLSKDKWDELFIPLLSKHGYKEILSGSWVESYQWEKTYLPTKK